MKTNSKPITIRNASNLYNFKIKMARPIEETPILEGKDAEEFLKDINTAKYSKKKEQFLKECQQIYNSTKK